MSVPVIIPLSPHYQGDKWVGIPVIGPILINGNQPADTLARIRMHFVHTSGAVFRLDSAAGESPDAPITISNATTWAATIPEVQNFLQLVGKWRWDMEFYATGDTSPLTLYRGVILVRDDITQNV